MKILLASCLFPLLLMAQTAPRFEVDPTWPQPLPDHWLTGELGGVCSDSHDHILVVNRREISKEEAESAEMAPPIIMFDRAGKVIASWGDPNVVPHTIHGCAFDSENNVWVGGEGDTIIQKYSHEGKLLMQIGTRAVSDSPEGSGKAKPEDVGKDGIFHASAMAIDPNGDVYVADRSGVAVFDKTGKFLHRWGRLATDDETRAGAAGVFSKVVHCIAIGNDGLVYVCDRHGDRIEVFNKSGEFQRNIWIKTGTPTLPDRSGTAWWVAFSSDPQQKYMYVVNGRNEQVHILDHASGEILASFGRPGHQVGNFIHGHAVAVDSHGNLYIGETELGRRIQKFTLVSK